MEIPISSKGDRPTIALCSPIDYENLMQHKWLCSHDRGYVVSNMNGKQIRMHRFIMNPPDNMVVDHINHCTWDNRRENLRIITAQENSQNLPKRATQRYRGVKFDKKQNKYLAYFNLNRRAIKLGKFESEIEAAETFDTYVVQNNLIHHLNFPEKIEDYRTRSVVEEVDCRKRFKSVYRGVTKRHETSFAAYVSFNKKRKHIGYFTNEIDAARARDQWVVEAGFNRILNFPEDYPNYEPTRKIKTPGVEVQKNIIQIALSNCREKVALVDKDVYEEWLKYETCYLNQGVYVACGDGYKIYRKIMNVTDPSIFIDHIDGDSLNNCRSNLRLSNARLNGQNKRKRSTATSQYLGVSKKSHNGWYATVTCDLKTYHVGVFDTEYFAARHRDLFIKQNFPGSHHNFNFKWTDQELQDWQHQ